MTMITRRQAMMSALTALAAVAGAGSALALPVIIQPAEASPVLAAAAGTGKVTHEEIIRLFEAMPPMKRLFVKQQMLGWDDDTDPRFLNIFGDKVPPEEVWNDVYPDWLSGFDDGTIAKFESGEWMV